VDEVVVNGVRYVPVTHRIGIAVTTHDRPDVLARTLPTWLAHLPEGAELVVVDDASEPPARVPDGVRLVRSDENLGIAGAKNLGIRELYDRGATDLFLLDDDVECLADGWERPYVDGPEPLACYCWETPVYDDGEVLGFSWPHGCVVYERREVIDRIGGWWGATRWGGEDSDLFRRAHNAGLTRCTFQDVHHGHIFHALDKDGSVASSVPEAERQQWRADLLEARAHSTESVDFRGKPSVRNGPTLSVLVPSVASRRKTFAPKIADALYGQLQALDDPGRAEVLMLVDDKGMSVGEKRNRMLALARGEYVAFVDDDDRVEDDYVSSLLDAIDQDRADCVTFDVAVSVDGGRAKTCHYSTAYERDENTATEYRRLVNHIMCVRRSLASTVEFPDATSGEDSEYARRLAPLLTSERHVARTLYHYDSSTATTETQYTKAAAEARSRIGRATKPSEVDVVIPAWSHTEALREMCDETIRTLRAGAGEHVVNVVVVEQAEGVRHPDAITLPTPLTEFNFNKALNAGARCGKAPWILFANDDLVFQPGWLDALLAARHDLVSPVDATDRRQSGIRGNEQGTVCSKHLAGWCFMAKRTLWDKVGGWDEDYPRWCADNSTIEQAVAAGVKPMAVPGAHVRHLRSQTMGDDQADKSGKYTWAAVRHFNAKYGRNLFANDARYTRWKQSHPAS